MAGKIIYVTLEQQGKIPERVTITHIAPQCCFTSKSKKLKWRKKEIYRLRLPANTAKPIRCPRKSVRTIDGQSFCEYHFPKTKTRPKSKVVKYAIDPYYETAEWRILRFDCLFRDKHICQYCGDQAHQADHVIPRKKGGADHLSNLVAACASCNRVAGGNRFESFEAKKTWVLAHRGIPEKRPTELLNIIAKEVT